MRIYLAARYSRREELLRYAHELEEFTNATVTSRWLHEEVEVSDDGTVDSMTTEERAKCAADDLYDLNTADIFIAFTEGPNCGSTRGGRHVELGAAIVLDKRIAIIGPRENIFCCLSEVEVFDTWLDCLHTLAAEYESYEAEIGSPA